jgi:hypothetical protein
MSDKKPVDYSKWALPCPIAKTISF